MSKVVVISMLVILGLVVSGPASTGTVSVGEVPTVVKGAASDQLPQLARRVVCLRWRWLYRCVRYARKCTYYQRGVCLRWTRYCVAQARYRRVCDKYGYR